jgi:hypothetical protein
VLNFDLPLVCVGLDVDLAYFAKTPSSAVLLLPLLPLPALPALHSHLLLAAGALDCAFPLEVDHLSHLQSLEFGWFVGVVVGHEGIQLEAELVGEDEVVLAQEQVFKGSLILCVQKVLYHVVPVDLSQQVVGIL